MPNYHNDQPITGRASKPDQLNREKFAAHLAEILTLAPEDDCLTVSLEGEWGYGKTSVVNLVKKAAAGQDNKPIIIEYNPWLAGKADVLIQDFLVQFSSQFSIPDRPAEGLKAAKELLAYSKLFSAVKLIPGAEPWASIVEGVVKSVGGASEEISKLKELDVIGRKNKVKETLSSLNKSIIVIIDDIDRLIPDEAFQVVRLVKAVADFPGTTFLLCFDPEYLTAALEKHGIKKADQYVDKVVQLRVPLPLIAHRDMQKLADAELARLSNTSLTGYFEKDQERLGWLYHNYVKYLIRTPRELKRVFNHLRLVLAQAEGEVSFADLYGLSVISIKANHIYQALKDLPEIFIGVSFDKNLSIDKAEDVVEKNKENFTELLNKCSSRDRQYIHGLIKDLFPLVDGGGFSGFWGDSDRSGMVASEKRLYIALHYQVPTGFAGGSDVLKFINGSIDQKEYLKKAIEKDFVERFFDILGQNIESITNDQITGILSSLYSVFPYSDYLASFQNANFGSFRFDPLKSILWISYQLIEKSDDKFSLIKELVQTSEYLPMTAYILRKIIVQHGDLKSKNPPDGNNGWLSYEQYQVIMNIWSQQALTELIKDHVLDSVHATQIYYTLLYNSSKDDLKKLLDKWLNQDDGIAKIAKLLSRTGRTDLTNGPSANVREDVVSELLDYSKLKKLAKAELSSGKELPKKIEAVYLSITTGEQYYLRDAQKKEH